MSRKEGIVNGMGRRPGWALAGIGILFVAAMAMIAVLIETGLKKGQATPTIVVAQSTSTFIALVITDTPVPPLAVHTPTPTSTPLPPTATHTPTATNTPFPPTVTATPTFTPPPPSPTVLPTSTWTPVPATPTPTLGIGTTRVWDKDGMVMVYVPAGEFGMGSADSGAGNDQYPQHTVYLDAFWIDRTEVTNAQYQKCVSAGVCRPSDLAANPNFNGNTQPVVGVNWNDAKTYCEWAGKQLPTEAQWEKAARGTDGRIYPWGNQAATCDYAVMDDGSGNGCGQGDKAWPVGSKPQGASPYGALDMAGNAWEWVADWWGEHYYGRSPAQNPTGPEGGSEKVGRGGSWGFFGYSVRATQRYRLAPTGVHGWAGFRCVYSGSE